MEEEKMFCIKCGNQFEGKFCDKCGAPAQSAPAQQTVEYYAAPQQTYTPVDLFENIGGKIKLMAKLMCAAILIVFLVLGIYTLVESGGYAGNIISGITYLILAPVLSFTNLFVIHGIAILVENSNKAREKLENKD